MTYLKTVLMTAALIALPCAAVAQIPGAITDTVKDKAVDTVLKNATKDDALTAGTVIFKGGSKEDAAVAIVKNRAKKRVDGVVGDQLGGVVGSQTGSSSGGIANQIGGVVGGGGIGSQVGGVIGGGGIANQVGGVVSGQAPSSAKVYEGAKNSSTTYTGQGSDTIYSGQGTSAPAPTQHAPAAPSSAPVNCPAGTTAQANGTCMITGNWSG